MAIYHIVLYKLKPTATPAQLAAFTSTAKGMVGKVPGLVRLDIGPPHESTKHRAQGWDSCLVAVLEGGQEVLEGYAGSEEHKKVHHLRMEICDETLAYDLEF